MITNTVAALLIPFLIQVESGGVDTAIGDGGRALGCLQIHAVCVADVNRISGKNYTMSDCLSRETSAEICRLYLDYYGSAYERRTGRTATAEVLARIWNGGPRGVEKENTRKYWARVKRAIDSGAADIAQARIGDGGRRTLL